MLTINRPKISPEDKEVALAFVKEYAKAYPYFCGGDILEAWRASGAEEAKQNWRNVWGTIMVAGRNRGWYRKVGRVTPTSSQSHTLSLARWGSNLFRGRISEAPTDKERIDALKLQVLQGKLLLSEALWQAYDIGKE